MKKHLTQAFAVRGPQTWALILLCGFLVACGGAESDAGSKTGNTTSNSSKTGGGATTNPTASKRLDACALLSKAEVERALGQAVKSSDLSQVTEGTAETAAFSQCTYRLDENQLVGLFVRRSPVADNTPEAIERTRRTIREMTGSDITNVSGVGDHAFWSRNKQLHVFAGENLYLYVTMMNFKDEAQAKAKATELTSHVLAALSNQK